MDNKRTANMVYRLMDSKVEASNAVDEVVACAKTEIRIFDSTAAALRDRDFGSPARIDRLRQLLIVNRQHRLRIVLHETRGIESELPRLMNLMALLSSQIRIHRSTASAREARDVMIVADDAHFWRKPYFEHPRSILTLCDPVATQPFVDRFEEIWQNSEPAVSGGMAGL